MCASDTLWDQLTIAAGSANDIGQRLTYKSSVWVTFFFFLWRGKLRYTCPSLQRDQFGMEPSFTFEILGTVALGRIRTYDSPFSLGLQRSVGSKLLKLGDGDISFEA